MNKRTTIKLIAACAMVAASTAVFVQDVIKIANDDAITLESGQLVLHKKASELLADPNIERLFLGNGHVPGVVVPSSGAAEAPGLV